MSILDEMVEDARQKYPYVSGVMMRPDSLVFEERVKMNCYYCGKYKTNWRCPGNMPQNVDYKKMMLEYTNGAFIYVKVPINETNYDEVRSESSLMLHKSLLTMEKYLWEHNEPLAISFIGGSCKLCKNGCGAEKCNNPYSSRSPLEAMGVNVVKSVEQYQIKIVFPPKGYMMRVGLLLW